MIMEASYRQLGLRYFSESIRWNFDFQSVYC